MSTGEILLERAEPQTAARHTHPSAKDLARGGGAVRTHGTPSSLLVQGLRDLVHVVAEHRLVGVSRAIRL